jgi:hypothetical protein
VAPLVPALVLARSVERARSSQAAPQTDLLCSLPALPLDLWPAGATPSPTALVLGVLAVAETDAASGTHGDGAAIGDGAVIGDRLNRVSALMSATLGHPEPADHMSKVGRWVEQRLLTAQWRVAAGGVQDLASALESGTPCEARHPDVRHRVHEGIAARYTHEDADRVLALQLASVLLAQRGPIDFGAEPGPPLADEYLIPSMFPVALDTIGVFQTALRGHVDARLASRVDTVRQVMQRPEAVRALDRVSFLQVYDIMCGADDAAFDAAIQYVSAAAGS